MGQRRARAIAIAPAPQHDYARWLVVSGAFDEGLVQWEVVYEKNKGNEFSRGFTQHEIHRLEMQKMLGHWETAMKRFVVLCCCTVTLMGSGCKEQVATPPATAKSVEAAPPAVPELKLPPTIDKAGMVALLAKHKGQPILLNVFASWCVPCKNELPALAKFASEHPRFVFIGIDVDQKDEDLKSFLPSIPKAFTVYRRADGFEPLLPALGLPKDWNEAVPPGWAGTVPVTLVFEKSGEFGTGSVGQLSPEAMEAFAKLDTTPGNAGSGSPPR